VAAWFSEARKGLRMKKKEIVTIALLLVTSFLFTSCFKVVKIGEEDKLLGKVAFDADAEIESIWSTKVFPELLGKAVSLSDLYQDAKGDYANVSDRGRYTMGDSGELNFTIKGTAVITEAQVDKKAGYVVLEVKGIPAEQQIRLQVGPLFKGTALRDNLTCISYDQYKNQVQWASISQALHNQVLAKVLKGIDFKTMIGKEIGFVGCMTITTDGILNITPVQLEVT
jgi:predicted lipoprotein